MKEKNNFISFGIFVNLIYEDSGETHTRTLTIMSSSSGAAMWLFYLGFKEG